MAGGGSERRRGRRWLAAGLAVGAVAIGVFVLAQAGGGGNGPLDAIARAAESTQREAGGHAVLHATVTTSDKSEGISENGSLIFENGGRTRGTLMVRGLSNGRRVKAEVIADGTTSYTSSDQLDSLPDGAKWIKLDLSSAAGSGSLPADGSPQEGLKLLKQMDDAQELGKEDIRGVSTTHYRGTLPVSVQKVFGVDVQISPPRVEVWIDARGRVRRLKAIVSGSAQGQGGSTADLTMDFVDFGPVPKIELPKDDEVFDITSRVESEVKSSAESP